MKNNEVKISKFLSLVLRHQPQRIGITLDSAGWVSVAELLSACNRNNFSLTLSQLQAVVQNNDKQRFAFSEDGLRIRASQGHSIEVELAYKPAMPPERLYHGTAERFLASIQQQGLIKGRRHHVHLSANRETALNVGRRHGKPVIFLIQSAQMHSDGQVFYLSANGVWLTEHVPVKYLELMQE